MEDIEIRSRAAVNGVLYIEVDEAVVERQIDSIHYWGMHGGRPSLYVGVEAPDLGAFLKERSIWLNRWFGDVVKIRLDDRTAAFLAAFALFDQFNYIFEIGAGMVVRKVYRPDIPGGCVWADVGLPDYMWEAAYSAYHFKKFDARPEREKYALEVYEQLKKGV
ncbi:MAG: hypothetical protein OWQ51_01630 [Pyrobaculum arsenaticum]|uniref:Uncharacterized protein n=2 Tax=Pyrobaculum arsenaticum TaxID=121277 RepID=A4WI63_PYRAR|nr:hypothetical protein [Pyrobaculum arsenaticum]ABP50080.1 conserved hypothetical protein [Pyrobaculum arsenaticum DSM 13514]MCY0889676.1 hypothetical protein [Pyrobaculum arsenaticum]NYR14950.1 hypothetical protein [Pyrobaculum arsenaticum]